MTAEQTQSPQLSIADLAVLKNIIELAAKRGAFQASEMTGVGVAFDKLSAFLDTIVAQAEAQAAEAKGQAEDQQQGEAND